MEEQKQCRQLRVASSQPQTNSLPTEHDIPSLITKLTEGLINGDEVKIGKMAISDDNLKRFSIILLREMQSVGYISITATSEPEQERVRQKRGRLPTPERLISDFGTKQFTIREVAKFYNVSPTTVSPWLRRMNGKLRSKTNPGEKLLIYEFINRMELIEQKKSAETEKLESERELRELNSY